jgi:NAD-dependent deacetylase
MSIQPIDILPELVKTLKAIHRVAVMTGAGISAESGVPTFREAQTGLWSQYDPQDLATPEAFDQNPGLVWEWYAWRRGLISQSQPNPGHLALVQMENLFSQFDLITQNVDGLHRRAGSQKIIELHGEIFRTKCSRENKIVTSWPETSDIPPRCPDCNAFLRPDVVWFGESLPQRAFSAALEAAKTCQIFFSIGTSSVIEPAASLPIIALQNGAQVIEINPNHTHLTPQSTYSLRYPAGEVLPALIKELT